MNTGSFNGGSVVSSFETMGNRVIYYLPDILGAIVILVVGIFLGSFVGGVVRRLVRRTGADSVIQNSEYTNKISPQFTVSGLVGSLVKWVIILAFLIPTADALNISMVSTFVGNLALYLPNVIAAVVILVLGFLFGDFLGKFTDGIVMNAKINLANRKIFGQIAKYPIFVFSIMAALVQLKIASSLIEILFAGLVLATALALGLGGKDHVKDLLSEMRGKKPE